MQKSKGIVRGALVLAISAFLSKFLGAVYRIPLTNVIKSEGLGLYQMVFPVYCVLLDFAGAGVPSALSKIIAERKELGAEEILSASVRLMLVVGLIGTALMLSLSTVFARLQGNLNAHLGYIFLAPSVTLVALCSCYRGYFQGKMNMIPTAITQVGEQIIKLVFGVLLSSLFMPNVPLAVGGATLAVTVSEAAAVLWIYFRYKKERIRDPFYFNPRKINFFENAKTIIKTTVPVTLVGIILPLSQFIDSFIVINLLKQYTSSATGLYGLLFGIAVTVINLPVSVCYGLSQVTIPAVSSAERENEKKKRSTKVLFLTFFVSLVGAIFTFLLSRPAVNILFRSLDSSERETAISLIKLLSPAVVFLATAQTENAALIGRGKAYLPLIGLISGVIVKTILLLTLVSRPNLNIFGGGISIIACYFTVCLVNLIVLTMVGEKHANKTAYGGEPAN